MRSEDFSESVNQALEEHITKNASQGTANGSVNCIADSWLDPLRGVLLMPWYSCGP